MSSMLPEWAQSLSRTCDGYTFATIRVYNGRSVVATRVSGTNGPAVVITHDEEEMRVALGLKPRKPPQ